MRYTRPPDVAWVLVTEEDTSCLYVMPVLDGRPTALVGSAADVWAHAVELGDRERVLDELARTYDVPREVVEPEAIGFLDVLVAQGLLWVDP